MKTVTYEGPRDPADRSTRYITADGDRFPKGAAVEVSDEVAKAVAADPDHKFKVQSPKGSATKED